MKNRLLLISSIFITLQINAQIINVPSEYSTIQGAMDVVVAGDTVLVDTGTYYENIKFRGKSIVVASKFILDHNPDHILKTIINGSKFTDGDSASCVIFGGEDENALLMGFTLTEGGGTKYILDSLKTTRVFDGKITVEGGGIFLNQSSAMIKNNLIINNQAIAYDGYRFNGGGGISSFRGNPKIYNNVIMLNRTDSKYGTYGYASGIVFNESHGEIVNNILYANHTTGAGGGLYIDINLSAIVVNNTIVANTAKGALINNTNASVFRNNIIWGNMNTSGDQVKGINGDDIFEYACTEQTFIDRPTVFKAYPEFGDSCFVLAEGSPCIDAGNPDPDFTDVEDSSNPGMALLPSMGDTTNDIGAYGGPYADVLPVFDYENLHVESSLSYIMNVGDTLTNNLIISNISTYKINIDSIVLPEQFTNMLYNYQFNGKQLKVMECDTISITLNPTQETELNDSLLIYHNGEIMPNPIKAKIEINTNLAQVITELESMPRRAHWKFDEASGTAVTDETGISDGEIMGIKITRIDAVDGKGLGFSSNIGNITVPHTDSIDFGIDESFTVSMLFKNDPLANTFDTYMLIKGTTGGIGKWYALNLKNGQIRFMVDDNINKTQLSYTLPSNHDVKKWHHIVGVRDREADKLYLYLDGELVAECSDNTEESIASGLPLIIDNMTGNSNAGLDDVQIIGQPLSAFHVNALYNSYDLPGLSSDASVTNLEVEGYSFIEGAFDPATKKYSVSIPDNIDRVNIKVTTTNYFTKVEGAGYFNELPGTASIKLTSEDETAVEEYTIEITVYTDIIDLNANNAFHVYPNPASTVLHIGISEELTGIPVHIFDMVGTLVFSRTITGNELSIDISHLDPGVYMVNVQNTTKRIVIK